MFAVNVKDTRLYAREIPELYILSDELVNALWEGFCEAFWYDADALARDYGFEGVHQEGRSGGWCVPYPQHTDDLDLIEQRFRPFESDVLDALSYWQDECATTLRREVAATLREPDEAAEWAARGVVTQ